MEERLKKLYWLPMSPITAFHSVQAVSGIDSDVAPGERSGISRKLPSCHCEMSQVVMTFPSLEGCKQELDDLLTRIPLLELSQMHFLLLLCSK